MYLQVDPDIHVNNKNNTTEVKRKEMKQKGRKKCSDQKFKLNLEVSQTHIIELLITSV
jgi:hypothetical protein